MPISAQKELIVFETNVRQRDVKQITLQNRTNASWYLKPIVEGEFFTGFESFIIDAQSAASYEIAYQPMTMTNTGLETKKHAGTVFFPLPDGTGLLYNLAGIANPPKTVAKIQRDVPCKTAYTEMLSVENWLKKPQRFRAIIEITKSADKVDSNTTTIKGHEFIDVPGSGKKEYKLNYYAHKEGVTMLKVLFKNEQTGEYCFYELSFRAVRGGTMATIDLITQVRVPVSHSLKLENPLATLVNFSASCPNNEILIPTSLAITAKGQVK